MGDKIPWLAGATRRWKAAWLRDAPVSMAAEQRKAAHPALRRKRRPERGNVGGGMMRLVALAAMMALAAGPVLAQDAPAVQSVPVPAGGAAPAATAAPKSAEPTFTEDDVLGAAEGVFGKGAEGLAEVVRKSFKQYGQPNAYIAGTEAGGAFIVGLRYGSGELHHKVEGTQPVHWTGPSLGFDVGGEGSKLFALVYNLNDSEEIFRRYPAAEGLAYFVGGLSVNYLQRDDVIIVPIKLGVGVRLGVNAGYMKFTKKGKIMPF
jgi:hypothetical protein